VSPRILDTFIPFKPPVVARRLRGVCIIGGETSVATRPARPCSHPRCPNKAKQGSARCEMHHKQTKRDEKRRQRAQPGYDDSFYSSTRWRKARRIQLAKQPLCEDCLERGTTTPAEEVDHIIPIAEDGALFDPKNHRSLCKSCHSRKTAGESVVLA